MAGNFDECSMSLILFSSKSRKFHGGNEIMDEIEKQRMMIVIAIKRKKLLIIIIKQHETRRQIRDFSKKMWGRMQGGVAVRELGKVEKGKGETINKTIE